MNWRFKSALLLGLASLVWFAALFQAAYDLWAACIVFFVASLLVTIFALRSAIRGIPAKIPFAPLVLLVVGSIWLSLWRAYDIDTTILEAWGWTFAFCLFYLFLNIIEDVKDIDYFFDACGLVMLPIAAICIWQQCTGHPDSWGHWEIQGPLINSLVLTGFALSWIFIFFQKIQKGDRLAWVLCAACLLVLCLARSWWGIICLGAGFLFYFREKVVSWFLRYKRLGSILAATTIFLFVIVVAIKIRTHAGPYNGSSRTAYWLAALKIWRHSPWTGVGLGGFATAYRYVRSSQFQSTLFAHSFPMQWLSETGILGIATGLIFLLGLLKTTAGTKKSRPAPPTRRAYQTSIFVILLFSLVSINMEYLVNKILLLTITAAWLSTFDLPTLRVKPLWICLFSLSLWMLSPFWLRMFYGSQSYMRGVAEEQGGHIALAEQAYTAAVVLDPYLADGYIALYGLSMRQFQLDHAPEARIKALAYLQKAIECKKDITYLQKYRQDSALTSSAST